MPQVLDKPQHEKFVQAYLKNGGNGREAYKAVYPAVKKDETADSAAARLLRYAKVQERMKELQHAAARETGVTLNGLIEKLGETYTKATADKQHAAAVSAVIAQEIAPPQTKPRDVRHRRGALCRRATASEQGPRRQGDD
jgi:phage terminase small subunit